LGITAYRRLVAANDWGDPLSVGGSLSALLFGRDEGFYYRTIGAELSGTFDRGSLFTWRVFAERQQNARKQTDFSVPHWINDVEFIDNIRSQRAELAGVAIRFGTSHGLDPHGWRLFTDTRAEGAIGDFDFARGAVDVTVSHGIGKRLDGAITLGAGTTAGDVPVQRLWYLGGVHTVRGQPASLIAASAIGNSFWMGRAELGSSFITARPVVFFDIGWAGDRARWSDPGRPISGAGAGASFLDGLIRLDVARGIRPSRGWRADLYLESRF
jgi:outer membrane protein assembly factor BamA